MRFDRLSGDHPGKEAAAMMTPASRMNAQLEYEGLATDAWRGIWRRGWSSLISFQLGSRPHLLAYNSETGEVSIDRVRPDLQGTSVVWRGAWAPEWKVFMPFQRLGMPHYLAYREEDEIDAGVVAIDRIQTDGQGVQELWTDVWSTGWTSFMPFELSGRPHFLAYKKVSGVVSIDRINDEGRGTTSLWTGTWSTGWTSFMPFRLRGVPHYLAYKVGTGVVDIDRIKPDGRGTQNVWTGQWSKGWTSLMPMRAVGQAPQFLSYKVDSGEVSLDRIRPDGRGTQTSAHDNWTAAWTHLVPFELDHPLSTEFFLAYKRGTGDVAISYVGVRI